MTPLHRKVIIFGSGPAGLTAAIYTARAGLSPLVIQGPLPGGQLTTTTEVENFPGFPDGVQGPDLMQLFEKQALRFGAELVTDTITDAVVSARPFVLKGGREYSCDALIIAAGASARMLGFKGEKELLGFGISTCATCDGPFFRNQTIAVVGGGDSACEEALFLARFGSKVSLIHRRDELRASKIMQQRVLNHEKIEVLWNREVKEAHGSREDGLTGVTLVNNRTGVEEIIECRGLFVAIGHIPNSRIFAGKLRLDGEGYIVPEPNSTQTDVAGVFACGDVQDHKFRQAITAAGSGCMAAIEAERWLESAE